MNENNVPTYLLNKNHNLLLLFIYMCRVNLNAPVVINLSNLLLQSVSLKFDHWFMESTFY